MLKTGPKVPNYTQSLLTVVQKHWFIRFCHSQFDVSKSSKKKSVLPLVTMKKCQKQVLQSQNTRSGPMRSMIPRDIDLFDPKFGFPIHKNVFLDLLLSIERLLSTNCKPLI